MRWVKRGLIFKAGGEFGWINSHAQVPKVLVLKDRLRVYFAPRPIPEYSCVAMMDLDIDNPKKIINIYNTPVLKHGGEGEFDEHGVMPQWVGELDGKIYLLYAGWSRRASIPYSNWVGLACSVDGGLHFRKMYKGPVLDRTPYETLSGTGLVVYKRGCIFYGFYANGTKWYKRAGGWDSAYEIVSAKSKDLVHWYDRTGIPLMPTKVENEANTAPTVVKIGDKYHMWFCYRGVKDYHDGKESYRIGYAWSDNLEQWNRDDSKAGIETSVDGFDSKMMAYPYVVEAKGRYFMFYNGNGFGQGGFGYAELEENDVK